MKTVILFCLFICSPAFPSTLKVGITQEWDTLYFPLAKTFPSAMLYKAIGRQLVERDPNYKLEPGVAIKVPTFENKLAKKLANGKVELIFEIHPKASWGDGIPLTCADFEFAHRVLTHPNSSVINRELFTNIEKIEWTKENPKKCKYTLTVQKLRYNEIDEYALPKHLEEQIFEKNKETPDGYLRFSNFTVNPTHPGLSYGPYVVSEYKLGSHVTFKINQHFYGSKPKIDSIQFIFIPATDTLLTRLKAGDINFIPPFIGLSMDQALAFEKAIAKEKLPFNVEYSESTGAERLLMNEKSTILANKNIRKALAYTTNKELINKSFFENKQTIADTLFSPADSMYSKNNAIHFNKNKAIELLEMEGWKLKEDGFRYKDGKKLSFVFQTTSGNKVREMIQTLLVDQWKKVGFDVTVKNAPARSLIGETLKCNGHEGMLLLGNSYPPGEVRIDQYHSRFIPTKENNCSGLNSNNHSTPKLDKLLETLESETDLKRRKLLIAKIINLYNEEVPEIPLNYRKNVVIKTNKLKNNRRIGLGDLGFERLEDWSIED